MPLAAADAVIVGAGLHGCSAALNLRRRGYSVVLLEKDHLGRHASSANAGGVRTLGRDPGEIALSLISLDLWHGLEQLVGGDCEFRASGQLRLAENDADLEKLRSRVALLAGHGFDHEEIIDTDEVYALLPDLRPGCVGGLICRRDGSANPLATMRAYRAAVLAAGVSLHEGVAATGARRAGGTWTVETDSGPVAARFLVNCAGAWADIVAGWVGDTVPLTPTSLAAMITGRVPLRIAPVVSTASRPLSLKQFDNGTVLISGTLHGTADRARNRADIHLAPFIDRVATVLDLFPGLHRAQGVRFWGGIEAMTPDGLPIVGPGAAEEGVFHAFGFCGHGFEMGPACGAAIAELVATGATNMPIGALGVGRFASPKAA